MSHWLIRLMFFVKISPPPTDNVSGLLVPKCTWCSISIMKEMWQTGSKPHAPHILLSASAEYQSAADGSHSPKLSQITLSDPQIVQNGLYCPWCVTLPLGKSAKPATFPWLLLVLDELSVDVETQPTSPAIAGGLSNIVLPDNINPAILSVQKALDDLQEKQYLQRKQLIFYWIELQLLHRQGVQCSKTHEVLTWGECEIANAIVHLTQYYGR